MKQLFKCAVKSLRSPPPGHPAGAQVGGSYGAHHFENLQYNAINRETAYMTCAELTPAFDSFDEQMQS